MTPLVHMSTKDMTKAQVATLRRAAVSKRPAAAFSADKKAVAYVGGDNATESEVSRGKSQLRRLGLLGRSKPGRTHTDLLAARRTLLKPGLLTVLEALAVFREGNKNALRVSPAQAFENTSWLWE